MAYEKLKKEQYENIGGINTKASVYVTGEREVLDIVNYDFSTPGALTPRWGMTTGLSGNTLSFGASNCPNIGFQVANLPVYNQFHAGGTNVTYVNYIIGNSGVFEYETGGDFFKYFQQPISATFPAIGTDGRGNAVQVTAEARMTSAIVAGNVAYKSSYDAGVYFYGLPQFPTQPTIGQTGTGASWSGTYYFKIAYKDSFGYIGASSGTLSYTVTGTSGAFSLIFNAMTFTQQAIWSNATDIYTFYTDANGGIPGQFDFLGGVPLALAGITQSFTFHSPGSDPTYPGESLSNNVFSGQNPTSIAENVEYYSSRLFWGSSNWNNVLFFTEPIETQADSETILPENTLLLPNQDFPFIACKAYNQTLMVFNQVGVTRLIGNALSNFQATELTREYGLVASRALVEWQERIWFLDQNHIVEYNGANFQIVSDRIQSFIKRINLTAAARTATAYHYEERREVWFAVPIDGSNENNIILAYDYLSNGWTTFKSVYSLNFLHEFTTPIGLTNTIAGASLGVSPSYLQTNKRLYVGTPGGSLTYFGQSFTSDNGSGISLSFKTRNHAEQGHSVTNLWRQLFLDTGAYAGVTLPFRVNFYTNFSTATISLTKTIYETGSSYYGPQQATAQMGLPAKALSMEFIFGGTSAHKVYGYTIERRFLRNV